MADTAVASETPAPATPAKKAPKAAAAAAAAKKPKARPTHPKTSDMVNSAIKELKERSGSSLQAIKKYIASNYSLDAERLAPFIRKYLKRAVASGTLIQTKGKGASGSFKIDSKSGTGGGAAKKATAASASSAAKSVKKPSAQAAKKTPASAGARSKKAAAAAAETAPPKTRRQPLRPRGNRPRRPLRRRVAASRPPPAQTLIVMIILIGIVTYRQMVIKPETKGHPEKEQVPENPSQVKVNPRHISSATLSHKVLE
ncbi:histone H1-like [Pieris brassicae]|uniref:histone H1-like n=1 Tax=Pieris brassicae TaxID=7116 RepID=UPI001E6602EB|nr:histone H1-like [Pieris brassicae]